MRNFFAPVSTSSKSVEHDLLMVRMLGAANGAFASVAALTILTVVPQLRLSTAPPLFDVALLVLCGLVITVALVALVSSRRIIKMLHGAVTVSYLALIASVWPVLALTGTNASGQLAWIFAFIGVPVLSAVICWGATGGWIVLGVLGVFIPLLRAVQLDVSANIITNDVQAFSTAILICAFSGALLTHARRADTMALTAREAGVRKAEAEAQRIVDVRAQSIVHDEVLATLSFAARAHETMRPLLAAQAQNAREKLHALTIPMEGEVSHVSFVATIESLARSSGAAFEVTCESVSKTDLQTTINHIPADVAAALEAAVQQSLTNSRTHAHGSMCAVVLALDTDGVFLQVSDDGRGFDPANVSPGRFGIKTSIIARLQAVGGFAEVTSRPGGGTNVRLRWSSTKLEAPLIKGASRVIGDRDARLAGFLIAVGQLMLTIFSLSWQSETLGPIVAGMAIVSALVIVSWRDTLPGPAIILVTALLSLIAAGTVFATAGLVPAGASSATPAGLWPVVGGAFVLGMLCLRGQTAAALVTFVPLVTVAILAVAPGAFGDAQTALIRSAVVVGGAATFTFAIRVLENHVSQARASTLRAMTERAWTTRASAQSKEQFARLDEMVGPVLTRIAEGQELSESESQDCLAYEGALRDGYRAGRLNPPLVAAAADRARRRGADVVLIDDAPGRVIADSQLDALADWLVNELDGATTSFLARVLPPGRAAVVTAITDTRTTNFGG